MFKKILLFLYGFYIIFLPNLVSLSPIISIANVSVTLFILNIIILNRKLVRWIQKVNILPIFIVYLCLIIYLVIIGLHNNNFTFENITSELLFIIYIINILSFLIYFRKIYGTNGSFSNYLINIGLFQAILIFLMLMIPAFKDIAVFLYSEGDTLRESLMELTAYRVYGIGSAYTFTLPLVQGFIALVALFKFDNTYEYKYFFYSLILIVSSVFNARTPIFIYLLILSIYFIRYLSNRINKKVFQLFVIIVLIVPIFFIIFSQINTEGMEWLLKGFKELTSFFLQDGATGNVAALTTKDHLFFPKGVTLILGLGFTISGQRGRNLIGRSSDIGYVNHLFKGGLFYTLLLYISHFTYFKKGYEDFYQRISIIIYLLVSNYKGEILVNNIILILSYALIFDRKTKSFIGTE